MTSTWQDVRCASIPESELRVLADLRREGGIRVTIARGRAWVCWDDGPDAEATRRNLVERLLPLAGVEIFSRSGRAWRRPGECLPAFSLPVVEGPDGDRLDRLILPEPLEIVPPDADPPRPVPLRLTRDERAGARPATALRCRPGPLAGWADRAPSAWIESVSAAWCAPAGWGPGEPEVLLIGPANRLPHVDDGLRFWGDKVLIPLGYRAEPELSDRSVRDVVGAGPDDLVVVDEEGPELIPRQAFRPLRRATIRRAVAVAMSVDSKRGGMP
jgi:MoxR-vWA-beta-propeller ternary system domain bpX2